MAGHDSASTGPGVPGRPPTDPKPAPDDLEILRSFVNTEGRFYGIDALTGYAEWSAMAARLLPGFELDAIDARGWKRLVRLRAAVRSVLGGEAGAEDDLNQVASTMPVRFALQRKGSGDRRVRLVAPGGTPDQEIATSVLTALQVAVNDGRIERLRLCERPECGWCYYDGTRNRSGRWCSTDPCGDVMKARAFRARQRAAG